MPTPIDMVSPLVADDFSAPCTLRESAFNPVLQLMSILGTTSDFLGLTADSQQPGQQEDFGFPIA